MLKPQEYTEAASDTFKNVITPNTIALKAAAAKITSNTKLRQLMKRFQFVSSASLQPSSSFPAVCSLNQKTAVSFSLLLLVLSSFIFFIIVSS